MDRGVRRRLSVLTFERTIPTAERIIDIGKQIAEREIDLLLAFAVAGAQRLLKQGAFTETKSGRQALARWIMVTDPVQSFIHDDDIIQVTGEDTDCIPSRQVYQTFRKWAETEGIPSSRLPTHPQFTSRVKEMALPELSVRRRGNTGSTFLGMKLKRPAAADR
jgi:putative DNA primase/helicase